MSRKNRNPIFLDHVVIVCPDIDGEHAQFVFDALETVKAEGRHVAIIRNITLLSDVFLQQGMISLNTRIDIWGHGNNLYGSHILLVADHQGVHTIATRTLIYQLSQYMFQGVNGISNAQIHLWSCFAGALFSDDVTSFLPLGTAIIVHASANSPTLGLANAKGIASGILRNRLDPFVEFMFVLSEPGAAAISRITTFENRVINDGYDVKFSYVSALHDDVLVQTDKAEKLIFERIGKYQAALSAQFLFVESALGIIQKQLTKDYLDEYRHTALGAYVYGSKINSSVLVEYFNQIGYNSHDFQYNKYYLIDFAIDNIIYRNDKTLWQFLIDNHFDFNHRVCRSHGTALLFFTENNCIPGILLSLEQKIDVNAKRENDGATALSVAAFYGYDLAVTHLLNAKNISLDEPMDDKHNLATPLMLAAQNGHKGIVKQLLLAGADPMLKGSFALNIAAQNGHHEIASLLKTAIKKNEILENQCRLFNSNAAVKNGTGWAADGFRLLTQLPGNVLFLALNASKTALNAALHLTSRPEFLPFAAANVARFAYNVTCLAQPEVSQKFIGVLGS